MITVAAFVLLAACTQSETKEATVLPDNETAQQVDSLFTSYSGEGYFSGNVLLEDHGKIILHKSYGFANVDSQALNNLETSFRIGSVTKPFTAVAIMQLYEQGKLELEAPANRYVDYPKLANVTVSDLLMHQSGLKNYTEIETFLAELDREWQPQELVEMALEYPVEQALGSLYSYSNTNYIVLGLIVEALTGQSYQEYVQANIFDPAGMHNSGFVPVGEALAGMAKGYRTIGLDGDAGVEATPYVYAYAAGGIYATTEDLYLFNEALENNSLIAAETFQRMLESEFNYGLGWVRNAPDIYYHDGMVPGFVSFLHHDMQEDRTLIVLSNNDTVNFGKLFQSISQILKGDSYSGPASSTEIALTDEETELLRNNRYRSENGIFTYQLAFESADNRYYAAITTSVSSKNVEDRHEILPVDRTEHYIEFRFKYIEQEQLKVMIENGTATRVFQINDTGNSHIEYTRIDS